MNQGGMSNQMQLSPGNSMPNVQVGSNQMSGLIPNNTLAATLQNQSQSNLGRF